MLDCKQPSTRDAPRPRTPHGLHVHQHQASPVKKSSVHIN